MSKRCTNKGGGLAAAIERRREGVDDAVESGDLLRYEAFDSAETRRKGFGKDQ